MAVITIIGAGMMGSAMSCPARDNGHTVRIVGTPLDRAIIDRCRIDSRHEPMKRTLPAGITYYQVENIPDAIEGADLIICGVSSFGVEWFAKTVLPLLKPGIPVLAVTKGLLDNGDGSVTTYPHYYSSIRPDIEFNAIGGPCTSYELMDKHQTMVCFCGKNPDTLKYLKSLLQTSYYHIETSTDIIGVESCVALKNAFAVAVSMGIGLAEKLEGKDAYMYNPQAALFGQSIREMSRIVKLFGGDSSFAASIPGAGDLFVTIFGGRTRRLGYLLGLGKSYAEAKEILKGVTLESVVIITRMGNVLRTLAAAGKIDLKDFRLILYLDSIINNGCSDDIPWDEFI